MRLLVVFKVYVKSVIHRLIYYSTFLLFVKRRAVLYRIKFESKTGVFLSKLYTNLVLAVNVRRLCYVLAIVMDLRRVHNIYFSDSFVGNIDSYFVLFTEKSLL